MPKTTWLLDGNVLIALVLEHHEFHKRVKKWLEPLRDPFATCVITQGALLRLHMKLAADSSAKAAWQILEEIAKDPLHVFWDDGFGYLEVSPQLLHSHRQVTDAWLAELARRRGGKLATLDGSLVALHRDVTEWVPIG